MQPGTGLASTTVRRQVLPAGSPVDGPRANLDVIFNPIAGKRRRRRFQQTIDAIGAAGCRALVHETDGPGAAADLARSLRAKGAERIIVAGGDGTINETVNGLMTPASGMTGGQVPDLGIIPLGTANVLACEIGVTSDPETIARTVIEGRAVPITLGRAADRYFVMMAGIGLDAHSVRALDLSLKRRIGAGAYWVAAARMLMQQRYGGYTLTLPDGHEIRAESVIVANGRCYGGPHVLAPEASLGDPALRVVAFTRGGRLVSAVTGIGLVAGFVSRLPWVTSIAADAVTITGPASEPVQCDGELAGDLPVAIVAVPNALNLVMPLAA